MGMIFRNQTNHRLEAMRKLTCLSVILLLLSAFPAGAAEVPADDPLPADGREWIEPSTVLLHWAAPVGNPSPVEHYRVLLDTDQVVILDPLGLPDIEGTVDGDAELSFAVADLDFDQTYYWRVDTVLEDATVVVGPAWSFRTEAVDLPGVAVDYSADPANIYLMSPSVARLPDGTWVVSHDQGGPGMPAGTRTMVLESRDDGVNWTLLAVVEPLHWASLFYHQGSLYLLGDTGGGADSQCVIHRSDDGGHTWTEALDENTGVLFADTGYHTAPVPVVIHNGRLWRAMEDIHDPGEWGYYFRAFVMSAPVDADLLVAANWTVTNRLSFDEDAWPGIGWLEGNAVVTPEGEVVNLLRVADVIASLGLVETAAMVHVSADGTTATFDPETDLVDFPGGGVKFTIRYDETSGLYWSLVNKQRHPYAMRNRLSLTSSPDLRHWNVVADILWSWDPIFHAWQYVDWLIDGSDIVFVSRTAHPMGGGVMPHGYHDANFTTFHRIPDFRDLADDDDDDDDDNDDDNDDNDNNDATDDDAGDDDAVDDDDDNDDNDEADDDNDSTDNGSNADDDDSSGSGCECGS